MSATHNCDVCMYRNKPTREEGQEISGLPTYTIPEAAGFLAIPKRTLFEWYEGPNPVLKPSHKMGNIILLSFRDLEEAYKIHILRAKENFSLQYLRKAMTDARKQFGSDHPLVEFGKDIAILDTLVMSIPGRGKRKRRSVALGSPHTPAYIPEVVRTWGKRIISRTRIFPWRYFETDENSCPVAIDPEVMSGRLVVTGTRIPVNILWGRMKSGESVEEIAKDYRLETQKVHQALKHIDKKVA